MWPTYANRAYTLILSNRLPYSSDLISYMWFNPFHLTAFLLKEPSVTRILTLIVRFCEPFVCFCVTSKKYKATSKRRSASMGVREHCEETHCMSNLHNRFITVNRNTFSSASWLTWCLSSRTHWARMKMEWPPYKRRQYCEPRTSMGDTRKSLALAGPLHQYKVLQSIKTHLHVSH